MQIVLSGNRVIAHGDNCFLAMGGTVICEETGKAYSNATIAEVDAIPADIDRVGYEYHAGIFVPCAPYGKTKDGYLMAACFECGTPRSTDISISDVRDRLNTYATILVSYPEGSECTCEKGGVILTASDTSGSYAFNVPEPGTWTIKATNGTDTAEKAVEITKRWQFEETELNYFKAYIYVEWPTGETCTCSDGVTTLSAPDTSGNCVFTVDNAGTWVVSCVASGYTLTESVEISTTGQSETVELALLLYDSGNEYTDITGGWSGFACRPSYPAGTYTENADNIYIKVTPGPQSMAAAPQNLIDLTMFNQIEVTLSTGQCVIAVSEYRDTNLHGNRKASANVTGAGIHTLDISNVTGKNYVAIFNAVSGSGSAVSCNFTKVRLL